MNNRQTNSRSVHWHMAPGVRERLLVSEEMPLSDWLREGTATVVKDAPHRAVYRVRLPEFDCYVKHYRMLGFRSHVRAMLRPNKARREFEIALSIQRLGVAAPEPLAWGVERSRFGLGACWLVTRTIDRAVPLLEYLENGFQLLSTTDQSRTRQCLANSIAEFVARLHAAGIVHADLHPGNLLLRFESGGKPQLWLIDLHAVSLESECSWPTMRDNLVTFNRYFAMRAFRSDRLRFWLAYRKSICDTILAPTKVAARELERLTLESNRLLWRSRDARSLASNRYYIRVGAGATHGHAVRDIDPELLTQILADPEAQFRSSTARTLKDSRSSQVVELENQGKRLIFKRFRVTNRKKPWLRHLRHSAAIRSWIYGHGLRERCLPTARPLLVLQHSSGEEFLLTEKIENAIDLHQFVQQLANHCVGERSQRLNTRSLALARLIRALHDRGIAHRDLKAANILTSAADGDARFWFIDLVGVRRLKHVGWRRRALNLARLNSSFAGQSPVSCSDRLRFLRAYMQDALHGSPHWKRWWRVISAATQAKKVKNARNGRPLA